MSDRNFRQLVILSGKGGTGKTTISSALATLVENKIVIDCDVDAANLYLILEHERKNETNYIGGFKASIDESKCMKCNKCKAVCNFDAIKNYEVDTLLCEGCGFCYEVCARRAIALTQFVSGSYFECELTDGSPFYYAKLKPGEGNSGKLVSEIKKKALEKVNKKTEWIIVDGPPGIGCPVNASLSGVDFVLIVTEASQSGLHDLKRLAELLQNLHIKYGIIINKYNLNEDVTNRIINYSTVNDIPILGRIPFNPLFPKAIQQRKTITEVFPEIKEDLIGLWNKVYEQFNIKKTIISNEVEK